MSESCPLINEEKFLKSITEINEITNGKFESELATCPEQMGGKRKRKMRSRKMRGGAFSKVQVKTAIYIILALMASFSLAGEGAQVIIRGIEMIIKGECGYLINRMFFQHPVCAFWNSLVTMVGRAINGDPASITQLSFASLGLINTPGTVDAIVDGIASKLSSNDPNLRLNGSMSQALQIENNNNLNDLDGGRRRRKSRKNGGKKSKKHGKKHGRRTRRHRK
jgi:hypothetical protein